MASLLRLHMPCLIRQKVTNQRHCLFWLLKLNLLVCTIIIVVSNTTFSFYLIADQVESQIALSVFGCNEKETPFINCLEWVEYEHVDGHWSFKQLKRLAIPHGLDYASILGPGKALCLIAREPLGIIFDSKKDVAAPLAKNETIQGIY